MSANEGEHIEGIEGQEDSEGKVGNWSTANENDKRRQEYFSTELKRLQKSLDKEKSKLKVPPYKAFSPYIHTSMEPYYNTYLVENIINMPHDKPKGYAMRPTSIGLCDPWDDHKMDVKILPTIGGKELAPLPDGKPKLRKGEVRPPKEGSTRLPKFPAVKVEKPTDNKTLYYSDVPDLRHDLKTKYTGTAKKKTADDYNRTKQDFFRMELDRLDEVHPLNRTNMKTAYYAYLQNTPGSKKAIEECVKSWEEAERQKEEQQEEGGVDHVGDVGGTTEVEGTTDQLATQDPVAAAMPVEVN